MEIKKLWKYFLFIFLIAFVIFNWSDIFWVFNYQAVSGFLSELFKASEPEKKELVFDRASNDTVDIVDENEDEDEKYQYFEKDNSIEIPKISIDAPLIFVESGDQKEIERVLNLGTVHFPESALPGKKGQTIILGHSAPPGWPKIRYDWVFSDLNELIQEDEIYIYFNNYKFVYSVTNKYFLDRGEELPQFLTNSKNVLVLISCWPPGKDYRRIAVVAQQQ